MDNETTPELPTGQQERQEQVTDITPEFEFPIADNDLNALIEEKIKASDKYFKDTLKLDDRRKLNEDFYLGKQLDETQLYPYQIPYKDNLIWQSLETRLALAAGRMPDIIVTPPSEDEMAKLNASDLQKTLELKVKSDMNKRIIKDGLRHEHLYLTGCIKVRWDKNRGPNGDIVYELVNPKRVGMDHTATIPHDGFTSDNMTLIYEYIEDPISVVIAKFPNMRDKILAEFNIKMGTTRQLSSKMKYLECWFTFYNKEGKPVEGVCWKYNKLILGKRLNPDFDFEGYEKSNDNKQIEQKYRNFFDRPRKPYIWFSYQNLGISPMDSTSAVEQAIPLQRIANKRGRQITEIADNAVPKKAYAGAYITKEDASRATNDPEESLWFEGAEDINKAVSVLRGDPPSPMLYDDLMATRGQIDSKFATHSVTRGEKEAGTSGISKQITREGDMTIADDMVDVVVERVVSEMAQWAVQMMKMFYKEPHYVRSLGREGEFLQVAMSRDRIDDGIGVDVKANTIDKPTRRNIGLELAASRNIDPLTLYEDLDVSNPKERAKRLMYYLSGTEDGYARYMAEIDMDTEPTPLTGDKIGPSQEAILDIQRLTSGDKKVNIPEEINPQYVETFIKYVNGPDFAELKPELQQNIQQFIAELKAKHGEQQQTEEAPATPAAPEIGGLGEEPAPAANPMIGAPL